MTTITLRPVDDQNRSVLLAITPAPGQEGFVESPAQCLADAAACPHYRPLGIYLGEEPVGFAMVGFFPGEGEMGEGRVWMDRLLIDAPHQGRGLGRAAMTALLTHLEGAYGNTPVYLSLYTENTAALSLYETFGFAPNGEWDENGEQILCRPASPHPEKA